MIHNLITSRAVPELVIERGGTPVRSRVGHSYIKALMAETGAIFGGEHSAHYYFRDFWGADSGMLAALYVLAALGEQQRPLSELTADYQRYEASGEINFTVTDAPGMRGGGAEVVRHPRSTRIDHLDGVTVDLGDGSWFNLRTSNTEPLLRLNVEARTRRGGRRRRRAGRGQIVAAGQSSRRPHRERHPRDGRPRRHRRPDSPPTGTGCCARRRWQVRRCAPPRPRSTRARWTRCARATVRAR